MKYLLILLIVLVVVGLWRSSRQPKSVKNRKPPVLGAPQDMVQCQLCSLHIPRAEAVEGKHGLYCGNDHRHRAED